MSRESYNKQSAVNLLAEYAKPLPPPPLPKQSYDLGANQDSKLTQAQSSAQDLQLSQVPKLTQTPKSTQAPKLDQAPKLAQDAQLTREPRVIKAPKSDLELSHSMGQLGLSHLQSMWLDPESVVVGEEMGRGATGVVHKGTWKGNQVGDAVKRMQAE